MSDIQGIRSMFTSACYAAPEVIARYDPVKLVGIIGELLAAYDAVREALEAQGGLFDNGWHTWHCMLGRDMDYWNCQPKCRLARVALGYENSAEAEEEMEK